jgi:hypothetical protein
MRLKAGLVRAVCVALLTASAGLAGSRAQSPPAASLSIAPAEVTFDEQPVGEAGAPKPVIVTCSGHDPTQVSVLASGIDFSETDNCGVPLAPGASCTIEVTFKPAIAGPRLGTLNITGSNPASPHIVVLTGVGK